MNAIHKTVLSTVVLALALSGPLAIAQTKSENPPDKKASTSRSDARPIEGLLRSAQLLRDAIHEMAKAPAGPDRTRSIKAANRALAEVQSAMADLPSDLLIAAATENTYMQSVDSLQQSSDNLRKAAQALAGDPYSKRRNETIREINQALLQTQQVMIYLPMSAWKK